jgi:hypothetical protein
MEWTIGGVIGGVIVGVIGGAVIGVISEPFLSALAGSIRPVAKEVVKGGLIVVASASELVEGVQKEWSTIVTEAQAELEATAAK